MSTPAPPRLRLLHSSATASSIDLAITGEQQDGRLKETYSNIALMYGAVWDFAAAHNGNLDWKRSAAAWNEEVNRLYRLHNTFFCQGDDTLTRTRITTSATQH